VVSDHPILVSEMSDFPKNNRSLCRAETAPLVMVTPISHKQIVGWTLLPVVVAVLLDNFSGPHAVALVPTSMASSLLCYPTELFSADSMNVDIGMFGSHPIDSKRTFERRGQYEWKRGNNLVD
jgi:hypothetical protein